LATLTANIEQVGLQCGHEQNAVTSRVTLELKCMFSKGKGKRGFV